VKGGLLHCFGSWRPVVGKIGLRYPMKPDYFLPKPSFLCGGNP
jgi:hypothetical protein